MNPNKILIFFLWIIPFVASAQKSTKSTRPSNASFYHNRFHGQETSNGETYNKDDFTAAHKTYPFNTLLLVKNKKTNKSVVVRVNDRGPFKRSRVLDLSYAAAKKIGMVPLGVVPVKIEVLKYLDGASFSDSLFGENNTWDCFGNRKQLSNTTVFIWKTNNWKHAFYMASSIVLDYHMDSLVIKTNGENKNRLYSLLVTGIDDSNKAEALVALFKKDGFTKTTILKQAPLKVGQHVDQSLR